MPPDGTNTSNVTTSDLPISQAEPQAPQNSSDKASLINRMNGTTTAHKRKKDENSSKDDPRLHDIHSDYFPPLEIVWRNVALFVYLHAAALVGLYFLLTGQVQWKTILWTLAWHLCGAFGITAGAHRLWAHKSYKAKLPLRVILAFMQTVSFQNSIHEWSRDHRVHHKYSETHADPHNARRGFFFAHMGWLMARKHPMVKEKGQAIDMSDLEADPVIMFQKKYYTPLVLTISFLIPTLGPWYLWGESFVLAWCFCAQLRYCFNLHCTWLVNSAAHMWGSHPYDATINPSENKSVAVMAFGEGWHNYHHTFPWDYKAAELGNYDYNFTLLFIDFFAWIGWAYDLKSVSEKVIEERVKRTGDGSHGVAPIQQNNHHHHHHNQFSHNPNVVADTAPWGWGDKDIPKEDAEVTETLYPLLAEPINKDD